MRTAAIPRFQVYISADGLAEIDGTPIVPELGHSVQEAVLDRLHRLAQQHATPVAATVNDSVDTVHFVLKVFPDGSSRLVDDQPTAPASAAEAVPVPAPAPAAAPVNAVGCSAVAAAISRAHATAAARAAVPVRRLTHASTGRLSEMYAAQLSRIHDLEAEGRVAEAFADATALRESLSESLGAHHECAVEARAIEAYLAHRHGDHRQATVLALGVARIRCGSGDERAPADVARAAAAWQRLDDQQALLVHATELLHMWDTLRSQGLLPPAHTELAEQVRSIVDVLAPRTGPSTGDGDSGGLGELGGGVPHQTRAEHSTRKGTRR
ncbi:hypothetical protein PV415_39280 [Streptomyces sp. ME03-5684b]|uniref:hypothetical protein n=1 Tax=Streptomyces sp. ME03-5684b TaxID=3028681 RepID=UPI0029B858F7|nr:hypothetical protein [Streptomyces sp. ME03-5684b]MDX3322937.1 hypothetical protein [Streptomyces sp. ME03-5684b]